MKIFAIADLHFDYKKEKPMDVFGANWENHEENIIKNWQNTVSKSDLVLIPGDISWALKLNDAVNDLKRIDELPGIKIVGKGNHDYWWSTTSKLNKLNLNTIKFIKNNFYKFNDYIICGTKGWDTMEEHSDEVSNKKVFLRELNRLKMSIESAKSEKGEIIVMLHYPPFDSSGCPNEFFELMKKHNVSTCIYGHLHGEEGHKNIKEGLVETIKVHCVSSDYLKFKPKLIL